MKPRFRRLASATLQSVFVASSITCVAHAADQTWTGATSTLWSASGNWSSAVPGASDVAVFDTASTANLATTLGADTSILGLKVVAPSGAVSIATGNTLTLGGTGIDMSAAIQNLTVNAPVTLGANQSWNVVTGRTVTVTGLFTATAGVLTKSGGGSVVLNNTANVTTSGIIVSGGTLTGQAAASSNVSLGAGPITLQGGGIVAGNPGSNNNTWTSTNPWTIPSGQSGRINSPNRMQMRGAVSGAGTLDFSVTTTVSRMDLQNSWTGFSGQLNFIGTGVVRLGIVALGTGQPTWNAGSWATAKVDLGGSVSLSPNTNSGGNTISIGSLTGTSATGLGGHTNGGAPTYSIGGLGGDSTYAGGITASNNIAKVGAGTLTLTHATALTYTGSTTVTEGTLKMNGVKTGAGATAVNTGATLAGTGSIAGTTSINSGGTLSSGDAGTGNLTFTNLTLNNGGILKLGAAPSDNKPVVTGTLTLASGATVDVNGFGTDGTYEIINITGATLSGSPSSAFTATNTVGGKVYTFSSTATAVLMTISSSDPSNYWNVDGGASWNTAANWTKGTVPNGVGANAKFGPGIGGLGGSFSNVTMTIPLDGAQTVGELLINEDFGSSFIIAPGSGGSLLLDNGTSPSSVAIVAGDHRIEAPVAVDPDDATIDVSGTFSFEVSGVLSSSATGAGITKSGTGTLVLSGANTYDGGTILGGGAVAVNTSSSLGSGDASFFGGSVRLLANLADSRSYKVSGANAATFDTNAFDYALGGAITPLPSATGGLIKNGTGTLSLSATNTYTGSTAINAGVLDVVTGGSIATSAVNVANAGSARLVVSGGSFIASGASNVANGSLGILVSGGSASFNGGINANNNQNANQLIAATGGTFSAGSITLGRSNLVIATPAAGATGTGFYVNGSTCSISGGLSVGYVSTSVNSSATARIDSGSLTVGGVVLVTIASPDRWSVLDVNGGTFTSTNTATGVQVGSTSIGSSAFLVRNGTATVERILLTQPATSTETSLLNLSGGSLYIGAGGIVGNINAGTGILDVQLGTATLGAKANWSSSVAATLSGTTTIKAASELDAAANITLSGAIGGAGGFDKTGAGTLTLSGTNTYAGSTNVNAGTLVISGDQSGALGAVSVATGATLAGTGSIGGSVTVASGARQAFALAATAGAQVTRQITGALSMDSASVIDLSAAGSVADGVYVLATAAGGITGLPTTVNLPLGVSGTLAVNGNNLELTVGTAGYASWASTNGLTTGVNDGPTQDPDGDGIENVLEFVLGGLPLTPNTGILPTLNASGANFVFTFNRSDESEAEVALTFQQSPDLAAWTPVAIGAGSSLPTVSVTENGTSPDLITVTIPKGSNTKLFGRLQGTK